MAINGSGTKLDPWVLKTASGSSEYQAYKDPEAVPPQLVFLVSSHKITYHMRAVEDLYNMLRRHRDWMDLGECDEDKKPKPNTVEAWGRDTLNPMRGWYGLKPGVRGRFAVYLPPLLEALGMAELTHEPRGNRMRAIVE
ncbi:MAG: hypothetical protein IPJ76_00930 [Flavobacteriales bacterium]|nr:MAG: hypothetical protein IPJ76_00930 [Flavobacteriales bacterium]